MSPRSILARLVLVAACVSLSYAQGFAQGDVPASSYERWGTFSEQEREVLRDRFERFRALDTTAQEALRERHSSLRDAVDLHVEGLAPQQRTALEALEPEVRKRVARDLFHAAARLESGIGPRGGLSAMAERLREVEPGLRPQYLKRVCGSADRELSEERVAEFGRDLGLPAAEFEALSHEERKALLRERLAERFGQGSGHGFGGRQGSGDSQRDGWRPRKSGEWDPEGGGSGRDGFGEDRWRPEGSDRQAFGRGGGLWRRGRPALLVLEGLSRERASLLFEAARPQVSDFVDLSEYERRERHRLVDERVRARILEAAREMPAGLRARLLNEDVPRLMDTVRAALAQ